MTATSTLLDTGLDPVEPPQSRHAVTSGDALPPVASILAALLWLAARQRETPRPQALQAIARQTQRLAIHPDATAEDKRAGLRLACECYHDALLWLAACESGDAAARH